LIERLLEITGGIGHSPRRHGDTEKGKGMVLDKSFPPCLRVFVVNSFLGIKITGTNTIYANDAQEIQFSNVSGNIQVNMPSEAVGQDYTLTVNDKIVKWEGAVPINSVCPYVNS